MKKKLWDDFDEEDEEILGIRRDQEDDELPEGMDEFINSIHYSFDRRIGFKDLKENNARQFLRGMAYAYECVAREKLDMPETDSGSRVLDRIIRELSEVARERILIGLCFDAEEMLTQLLDHETEQAEKGETPDE